MDIAEKSPYKRSYDPLGLALVGALAFHALLILGVTFDIQRNNPPAPERTLDITLVTPPKKPVQVEKPEMLAQASQQGGGEKLVKQRSSSPLGNPLAAPQQQPAPELERAGNTQPEAKDHPHLVASRQSEHKREVRPSTPPVDATPRPDLSQLLSSTQREIDRLTAEIDRRNRASSSRERRKAINASTQEYKFASYMETWRKKVERIGNLNYPDEAKRRKLSGSLLLHVSVRADGSIEQIRMVKSSGHKILDDAAKRIVRLAAPFAPFPPNIRDEVDVLDITRTWQFRSGSHLFSSD